MLTTNTDWIIRTFLIPSLLIAYIKSTLRVINIVQKQQIFCSSHIPISTLSSFTVYGHHFPLPYHFTPEENLHSTPSNSTIILCERFSLYSKQNRKDNNENKNSKFNENKKWVDSEGDQYPKAVQSYPSWSESICPALSMQGAVSVLLRTV